MTDRTLYGVLVGLQILGSVILVASLFHSGLTLITVLGGALIVLAIGGMAAAAFREDENTAPTAAGGRKPAAELGRERSDDRDWSGASSRPR